LTQYVAVQPSTIKRAGAERANDPAAPRVGAARPPCRNVLHWLSIIERPPSPQARRVTEALRPRSFCLLQRYLLARRWEGSVELA